MKSYFVNEEDFDTLRKVASAGEGEEDLYLRSDVKELGDAREARLKGAVLAVSLVKSNSKLEEQWLRPKLGIRCSLESIRHCYEVV
jgi:hypothetical protein